MNIKITSPPSELKVFESRANAIYAKRMKRTARKKEATKKDGTMPTKTQVRKATLAKKQYRYSNDCKYRERKKKASHEYQRAFRKKLNKVTEMKEKYNAKKAEYMVWKRAYKKWAVNHNKRYMSEFDKVAPKMSMKDAILSFGKVTMNYLFVFPRMKTLGQDIYYEREPLGKMGEGIFQEITPASMQNVTCMVWTLLGGDWHASFMNSLDIGSGMGNPST